jgi:hypothetical protein
MRYIPLRSKYTRRAEDGLQIAVLHTVQSYKSEHTDWELLVVYQNAINMVMIILDFPNSYKINV